MPSTLNEDRFFDPLVPLAWEPVLEDLRDFLALEEELRGREDTAPNDVERARLDELHARLVERSADLLEPEVLEDIPEHELHEYFIRTVLLMSRMAECVHDGGFLDTAKSEHLHRYETDFTWSEEASKALRDRLCHAFDVRPGTLRRIEAEVEWATGGARRKQAVTRALRAEFGLEEGAPELDERVHALFDALFPGVPLATEEVKLILTGTLVFLCVPFEGTRLTTARFDELPAGMRRPIEAFLEELAGFQVDRFANFPAFGFLSDETLDAELVAGLAPEEVSYELRRMVTVLPLAEIDKYVVHDVWGHSWQASMLRFGDAYEEMARYAQRFDLDTATAAADGSKRLLRLADCFDRSGGRVKLDEEAFVAFFYAMLAERLPVALSAVLAELMADVAEYKLLSSRWTHEGNFESSSYFRLLPSKLDLTLRDVRFYYRQATKTFRTWAASRKRQAALSAELVARGASPAEAEGAVAQAVELWRRHAEGPLADVLQWERGEDGLRTNAYTRAVLNFLGVHRALLEAYQQLGEASPESLPLLGYHDLLVLGASVFFEADRVRNLWRIDEFLSVRFVELCRALGEAEPEG